MVTYITDYYSKDESGITEILKQALKETQEGAMPRRKALHHLKKAYVSKRQIGLSEAIYRILPSLHLRQSDVTTVWVPSGFPENQSQFMSKVPDHLAGGGREDMVKVEGRSGFFQKGLSVQDKYKDRPKDVENLSLAQFATCYKQLQNKPKKVTWKGNISVETGIITNYANGEKLPKYLKLSDGKIQVLRTFPAVMRYHASKKKEGYEEQFSEMQLFYPWRDEKKDLHYGEEIACQCKYIEAEVQDYIRNVKGKVLPFVHVSEEVSDIWAENGNEGRPSHIFDTLDAAAEQDNLDAQQEGEEIIPMPETDFDNCNEGENAKQEGNYNPLTLKDDDTLLTLARSLVPEQLQILLKVLKFCKMMVLAQKFGSTHPLPLRLIVHGGAGRFLCNFGIGLIIYIHVLSRCWEKSNYQSMFSMGRKNTEKSWRSP